MTAPHTKSPLMRYIHIIAMNVTLILCVFGVHEGAKQFFGVDFGESIGNAWVWSFIFAYTSLLFIFEELMRHSLIVAILLTAFSVTFGLSAGLALKLLIG